MKYLICRHETKDYETFVRFFRTHDGAHREAGFRLERVMRGLDDPNECVVLFEVHNLEKARAFTSSRDVPDAHAQSGLLAPPDMIWLSDE
jgi:heme-degrading monooxygenase HmoA